LDVVIRRKWWKTYETYIQHLVDVLTGGDNLKLVREEAGKFYRNHTLDECYKVALVLYQSEHFQLQEVGVFLCGYIGAEQEKALVFLKETVSFHPNWKVQEVLAMAFDQFCKAMGYEAALPVIEKWLDDENANVRRAVSEGLRIWTNRPYFDEHPGKAIALLAIHRNDESEYFRKSVGNALKDISKKYPELVGTELKKWDLSSKKILQVYKLASKFLH
jgi:3-methyladenine DNA glycosylase AlkC